MSANRTNAVLGEAFRVEAAGDIRGAIRLFKAASRLGSTAARSKLGTIYDDVLIKPCARKAVYWYKRGVQGGDSTCAWNLAMHYAGVGQKRGYLYWLRIASEMGDSDATRELRSSKWWNKRNAQ